MLSDSSPGGEDEWLKNLLGLLFVSFAQVFLAVTDSALSLFPLVKAFVKPVLLEVTISID